MDLTRRHFLRLGGLCVVAGACELGGLRSARAAVSVERSPLLVVVYLRGGADGLHLVPPSGDREYERARGRLAIRQPVDFVKGFGLHPSLEPLLPMAARGELAVVHASGMPDPTRSHFEAQDRMEAGAPGSSRVRDGWLARALGGVQADPFASLAIAPELPLSLRGAGSFAMADVEGFGLPGVRGATRRALASLYADPADDPVAAAGRRALAALDELDRRTGRSRGRGRLRRPGRAGARIEQSAAELVTLERAGLGVEVAFLESGGWDTHAGQGAEAGAMANWIGDLGRGMAALDAALSGRRSLRMVVMTEFGRTVRPNGSGGTDHGHGSAMLVAGRGVRGGVHGDWPGLRESQLYEGRDLPVTTDWRTPLFEVLRAHLGAPPPAATFPGFTPGTLGLFG